MNFVQAKNANLLKIAKTNELLLFASKDKELTLSKFEKAVYENFSSDILRARIRGLDTEGLSQFSQVISPHINPIDVKSFVSFTRMSRPGNCFLVLDDDPMILKQLDKILSSFGHVVAIQDPNDFAANYVQYAPDLLFLDIHLRKAMGTELLKKLRKEMDEHAHVVMISSDTQQETIMKIKEGNANGFAIKPFDRNKIYKEIMKSPTMTSRTS